MHVCKSLKVKFSFLKSLIFSKDENWQIAIRYREEKCLYEKNNKPFSLIRNPMRYWLADPFLFDYDGNTFLFAEMYDRKKKKGVIGFSKIKGGKASEFTVCLEEPFHLSYPCVFSQGKSVYMIPESCKSNKITVYKAKHFPYEWEKESVLCKCKGSDTTPVFQMGDKNDETWYLTTLYSYAYKNNDNIFFVSKNSSSPVLLRDNDTTVRPAGHLIAKEGKLIRPTQDDTGGDDGYGNSLHFKEVKKLTPERLEETEILQVFPPHKENGESKMSVNILKQPRSRVFVGLHTYNLCDNYEVIDLRYYTNFNIYSCLSKIKLYIKNKIGKG